MDGNEVGVMSAYDQVRKAYNEAKKNNFFDAWGIVASPKVIRELRAAFLEQVVVQNAEQGELETIFGLVVIPYNLIENDKVYIVNEMLGKTILRGRSERWEYISRE